jgi:serine/threonine-protein phosphatase PP1 catalytic subunit
MEDADRTRLDQLISRLITERTMVLSDDDVLWLLTHVTPVLLREPSVLDLTGPIWVCGDIHGQFTDLIRIFQAAQSLGQDQYLFLGDYVDRGPQSLEVICLLFALKLRNPFDIFLLRGNHESPEMTESFGFLGECISKLEANVYPMFLDVFKCLPIAAVINGSIFCVHGGLSPVLNSIQQIREIERPVDIPEDGLLADLLWSDPCRDTEEWGPNPRGATVSWGLRAAEKFMEENGIVGIMRGHQVAEKGYDYPFEPNRSVVTVFSAPAYANRLNAAAFALVKRDSSVEYAVITPVWAEDSEDDENLESLGTGREPFLQAEEESSPVEIYALVE